MSVVEFLSQPLWHRLSLTLVHFLWQGLAVAVLACATVRILGLKPGNPRYAAYLLAFALMVVAPLVTFGVLRVPVAPAPPVPLLAPAIESSETVPRSVPAPAPKALNKDMPPVGWAHQPPLRERFDRALQATLPWTLAGWMSGVLILSVRLLLGFLGIRRWRRNLEPLADDLRTRVALLSERLGLPGFSRVFVSRRAMEVVALGYLRPMVLLPAALVTRMPPEMVEAVIAHELAHIRRHDLWVNLAQRVVETLLFYHPAVWWLSNHLRRERELCCDALAVQATGERLTYASALETAGRVRLAPGQSALAVGLGQDRKFTLGRVRYVLGLPPAPRDSRVWLAGIVTFVAAAALALPAVSIRGAAAAAPAQCGDLLRTFQDPNKNGNSWFGWSVATVGDNVLVGAPFNRAAYLFDGSTGKVLRTFVVPPTPKTSVFGWCVAAIGRNILIADPTDETNGKASGRVYLFHGRTGELLRTFANPKPRVCQFFGRALCALDERRVIIGAACEDIRAEGAGIAYLFDASTGRILQVFQRPQRATSFQWDKASIAATGEHVLVGVPEDDTGAEHAGCVYLFDSSTGKLVRTFLNPTPTAGDVFGNWLTAAGSNVLIGAGYATVGGKRTGAAYLFDRGTGKLLRRFLSPAPGEAGETGQGDIFGRCVAFVGNHILIGSSLDDTGAENAGAAYLFDGATGKVVHKFPNPHPFVDARFGVQVAARRNDVLIAAYDPYGNSRGGVYLFKGVD
jgi:beta-lactamase regulating signal transducer with metallopeptidase domain